MTYAGKLEIAPGEIWAVSGTNPGQRSEWCELVAREEAAGTNVALLNFAQHAEETHCAGWPQARYYESGGKTVADLLSFDSVHDVNPFEVGARYPESRKAYGRRLASIMRLLDLEKLRRRPVIALSNGEMRRVLLARALAKGPELLVLDDPAGGLDVRQRAKLRDVIAALAKRGLSIIFAYRHADELPSRVTRWLKVGEGGSLSECANPGTEKPKRRALRNHAPNPLPCGPRHACAKDPPPVIEISNLNLSIGGQRLFSNFSWTVRSGERWVLCGENGCGKTLLLALITGDSPLAYAADVKVFGVPREPGTELARIRRRIGVVSPEMQAYLGLEPEDLLESALRARHDLLLLDEPFMNLDARDARRCARRIESHLRRNRNVTAVLVCHRMDEAPRSFDKVRVISGQ